MAIMSNAVDRPGQGARLSETGASKEQPSFADSTTNESPLTEGTQEATLKLSAHGKPWTGRLAEMRQLQRWLAMVRAGQPRSVLVLADEGTGKSDLIRRTLDGLHQQKTPFSSRGTVVSLSASMLQGFASPDAVLTAFDEQLLHIATEGVRQVQEHINTLLEEVQVHWSAEHFEHAFRVIKPASNDSEAALALEPLIAQSIPILKRWRVPISSIAQDIIRLLRHPWVQACAELLWAPIAMAESPLNSEGFLKTLPPSEENLDRLTPAADASSSVQDEPIQNDMGHCDTPVLIDPAVAAFENTLKNTPENLPSEHAADPSAARLTDKPEIKKAYATPADATDRLVSRVEAFSSRLIRLMQTAHHIEGIGFLWLDDWDLITSLPYAQQQAYRCFLKTLITSLENARNVPLMLMVSARCSGASASVGGDIFGLFRNRLLLAPLSTQEGQKLVTQTLSSYGLDIDTEATEDILRLSACTPLWICKISQYLSSRLQAMSGSDSSQTSKGDALVTSSFIAQQGFERASDLLELAFTTLRFQFFETEQQLLAVLSALLDEIGTIVFSAQPVVERVAKRVRRPAKAVFEVIRELYTLGFIIELERSANTAPRYQIADRVSWEFLKAKTALMQDNLPASDRLGYLKKILPFALKSGELTREKTQEILQQEAVSSGGNAGDNSIVPYLEELFLEAFDQGETVAQRVTALMNLSVLETPACTDALLRGFSDSEPLVREYAARILRGQHCDLFLRLSSQQQAALANALAQTLNDVDPDVRQAAVAALWTMRNLLQNQMTENEQRPAMPVIMSWLLDRLEDDVASIREVACSTLRQWLSWQDIRQQLSQREADHPSATERASGLTRNNLQYVHQSLLSLVHDASPAVVSAAAQCLQLFPTPETITHIADLFDNVAHLSKATLTALSETLARCEAPQALDLLLSALTHPALTTSYRMVIVRAITNRPDAVQAESTLLKLLSNLNIQSQDADIAELLPFVWVCVQSLGRVALSHEALMTLNRLSEELTQHEILQVAIRGAIRRIQSRMERFCLPQQPPAHDELLLTAAH
ncbi:MAG: sister chromatid cohesion protein PDS5 [Vampirovibrionales bacterium]|nr:sister chromatid cohesion protein PDS5 [Vampirovibrionales bacterium]